MKPADIENLLVHIHENLDEQEKVAFLDQTIAKLQVNIENHIPALEQTAQDIYNYWFVQYDFPDENGNPYRSSGGAMVWNNELKREIFAEWMVYSISDISDLSVENISQTQLRDIDVELYSISAYDAGYFPVLATRGK